MKILLDENFPERFKKDLSQLGHDVKHINNIGKGMTDKKVFELAVKEKRIIISNDTDFKLYSCKPHYGIINFSPSKYSEDTLIEVLTNLKSDKMKDAYVDFGKKGIYYNTKVFSKKGKFKHWTKVPINNS